MTTDIREADLLKACRVLFGPDIGVSTLFLDRSLKMAGLKAAYRKRARETHPDLARSLAVESRVLEEQFKEVQSAFDQLRRYLQNPGGWRVVPGGQGRGGRPSGVEREAANRRKEPRGRETPRDRVYEGPIPSGPLLFGRYLYYAGVISYRTLIDALVWQRHQRPAMGAIARQWGWLTGDDVLGILKLRSLGEKFGECAVRHGFLDGGQLRLLVARQKLLQPRLGAFFVSRGILTATQIDRLDKAHRMHNRQHRRVGQRGA